MGVETKLNKKLARSIMGFSLESSGHLPITPDGPYAVMVATILTSVHCKDYASGFPQFQLLLIPMRD